jgi:hypothetical protein
LPVIERRWAICVVDAGAGERGHQQVLAAAAKNRDGSTDHGAGIGPMPFAD